MKAEGTTESEAIDKVRDSLTEFLANAKLVKYSAPVENPWLKAFGSDADDPDFENYLEEIRKARAAENEE